MLAIVFFFGRIKLGIVSSSTAAANLELDVLLLYSIKKSELSFTRDSIYGLIELESKAHLELKTRFFPIWAHVCPMGLNKTRGKLRST